MGMSRIADIGQPHPSPARRHMARLAILALTLAAMPGAATAQISVTPACKLQPGPVRAVAHVLDGETVRLDDGGEVRLIGALAPRGSDVGASDADWPPAEAARQALAALVQGRSVSLAFGGQRIDRYGRWLAHLVVERDGLERWVQGELLEQGMARAYALPSNAACMADLIARERVARKNGRGLWLNAAYQIRSAERPDELLAYRHSFQLVAGRVASVAVRYGQVYINFEKRDRTAFSVIVRRSSEAPLQPDPRKLEGRSVLARGWIDRRAGPVIEIGALSQLELIDQAEAAGASAESR